MGFDPLEKENILQNLKDAGCTPEFVKAFMELVEEGRRDAQLKMLFDHRQRLLDRIHENQRRLDCLDYLKYQIQQKVG